MEFLTPALVAGGSVWTNSHDSQETGASRSDHVSILLGSASRRLQVPLLQEVRLLASQPVTGVGSFDEGVREPKTETSGKTVITRGTKAGISMITILGAGGAIGNELVKLLAARKQPFRLVGRNPRETSGATETFAADLTDKDQTIRAVAGSSVVHLLVGLKYDHKVWQEMWPRIMSNSIEACKRAGAKLIFFDNVYMYGKVSGPMTEETPFNPCSKKGEIRAKIATTLINEWKSGALTGMIARSADFYGPGARNGVPNLLIFEPFSRKRKASWLVNDSVPHSYTYAPDAAQSLVQLAERAPAWNRTWHVPTTPNPLTGKEFLTLAAKEFGVAPIYRVLSRPMIRLAGWFNPTVGETYEMLYQSDSPYLFDSSKFAREVGFAGTPYADGIRTTAASFKRDAHRV